MATSNLNIRIDDNLKSQAKAILDGYGISPSQAVKMFFLELVATRQFPLSLNHQASLPADHQKATHTLSANGERLLRESIEDFQNGEYELMSFEDFTKWAKDNA